MLFFAPLLLTSAIAVDSEPIARRSTLNDAIASAHCATLGIEPHPRGRIALAARICLRPGDDEVVEERGVIDLDRGRFTFVRAPFSEADDGITSWPPMCPVLDDERGRDDVGVAHDPVSRVLRDRRIAPCLLARASSSDHMLWAWRGALFGEDDDAPNHPVVSWSKSGRFVALHHLSPDLHEHLVVVESTVFDTRAVAAHIAAPSSWYVPRFREEVAEVVMRTDDGVESWLIDFRASPHKSRRGLALSYDEAEGLGGACGGDVDTPVSCVDVTTFRGFFDAAQCRRGPRCE